MDWIASGLKNGFWSFIADIISNVFTEAFKLMTDYVLKRTDVNVYINTNLYLPYLYAIAFPLLSLAVVFEAFKQNAGGMIPEEEKSFGTIALRTVFAGFLIYFLPKTVNLIFLKLNNALMDLINSIGIEVNFSSLEETINLFNVQSGFATIGATMILLLLVLAVGFLILGFASGIRYVELVLCVLLAPIVAVGAVRNGDSLNVWIRETVAITFTQSIHLILLKILMSIIGKVQGPMMVILCISVIAVMLQGPKVLRTFLYSSGVGSATVGATGSIGRMATMKQMMKSSIPTGQ